MLSRPEKSQSMRGWQLLLLLFPLALILPGLGDFPYPPFEGGFSDVAVSHYPAVVTLRRLIGAYGQIPLWSPHLMSGAPLAANPLYSFYYPPAWLALVLATGFAFGTAQLLRGAHYPSHTLWSAWLCWAICAAAAQLPYPGRVLAPAA